MKGNFSRDYILGIVCIGLPLINYSGTYLLQSLNKRHEISTVKDFDASGACCKILASSACVDFDKLGGFVSYNNISTEDALEG